MAEVVSEKEEISEEDVGKAEELLGDLREAVESEISPSDEVKIVAEVEADFLPLENEKVLVHVQKFHDAVLKIRGADFYRNAGKASYINYFVGKRKSIVGLHFAKTKARITMHTTDGKKAMGDLSYNITEDGFFQDGERVILKELIRLIKKYRSDRGWD